jgi:hypothetical protein
LLLLLLVNDRLAPTGLPPLQLQRPSEGDPDEDLEVMREARYEGEEFLCHAHTPRACFLCVGEEGEEFDCFSAEHTGFADVSHAYIKKSVNEKA